MAKHQGLSDHIRPGVQVLFVGINPGLRSAAVGHHFAGYSNRFWKLLYDSGLVPVPLTYEDDRRLPEWGFGLTNIVARASSGMHLLNARDYATGRRHILAKIRRYRPRVVALVGVTLFPVLFPPGLARGRDQTGARTRHTVGVQSDKLAGAHVFLLPNPSGRNAHYSYAAMLRAFRGLQTYLATLDERETATSHRRTLASSRENL